MLYETMQGDALNARKARDQVKSGLLTTIISQVKLMGINDGHRAVTDADVIKTIRQFLKSCDENLDLAAQGKLSAELTGQYKKEKEILTGYLPTQLTADAIKEIIKNSGAKNLGEAMKYLKEKHDGLYDGKIASAIAKEVFS